MELSFDNSDLENLSRQTNYKTKLPANVITVFRRKLQMLLAATNQSSFKNLKSMKIIPLKGSRAKKCFVSLTDDWRLILSFQGQDQVKILDISKS